MTLSTVSGCELYRVACALSNKPHSLADLDVLQWDQLQTVPERNQHSNNVDQFEAHYLLGLAEQVAQVGRNLKNIQ